LFAIIGVVVVTAAVMGGFAMAHGPFQVLVQPSEFVIIVGAALGGTLIGTPLPVLSMLAGKLPKVFTGGGYSKATYLELLAMLYEIFGKARKEGLIALEQEVNNPHEGEIFKKYPGFLKNHHAVDFLCDTLKLMVNGVTDTFEIEKAMDAESADKKHAVFGKYKGRINNYLSAAGIDMKKEEAAWQQRIKERKAAAKQTK